MRDFTPEERAAIERINRELRISPYVQSPQCGVVCRDGQWQIIGEPPDELSITFECAVEMEENETVTMRYSLPGKAGFRHLTDIIISGVQYHITKNQPEFAIYHLERIK